MERHMKYWLTTHWPPRVDAPDPDRHQGVWLQHDKLQVAKGMASGDLVLIYEAGSGKTIRERYPDGSPKDVPRRRGKQGVVALARILDQPSEREGSQPDHFSDGSQRFWKFMAPTESLNSAGFISRTELAEMLGYNVRYAFHGFGKENSGLKEISEELFDRLQGRFLEYPLKQDVSTKREVSRHRWGSPGGEGPAHLALKLAIAADPQEHLGESGLRHWATEYALPTGDTIDVVLTDEFGRFVVVEVEVDCDEAELVGPLQCMKYRALMSYLHKRNPSEVRAILVASALDIALASI